MFTGKIKTRLMLGEHKIYSLVAEISDWILFLLLRIFKFCFWILQPRQSEQIKKFPFRDKLCKCLIPYYPHTKNSDFQIFGSFKNLKSINFANRRNFFFEKQRISGWPIQSFLLTKALKSCQVLLLNKRSISLFFHC